MSVLNNDGGGPFGSEVLTINSVTYVAEDLSFNRPTVKTDRRDEVNEPSDRILNTDFEEGTATLQLAAEATAIPTGGMTFTRDAVVYVITEVGEVINHADFMKVTIGFYKRLNTP